MQQRHSAMSDETARTIDQEIRGIIDRNYDRAEQILREHESKLHMMAEALMQYETIDAHQIDDIMDGRKPGPPKGWGDPGPGTAATDTGSGRDDEAGEEPAGDPARQH
jgi:cell division protease FtsH